MQGNRAPLVLFGVGDNQFGISVWPADLNGDLSLLSPSLSQSGALEVWDSQYVADANSLFSPYNWSFPLCHQDTAKAKKYHLGVLSWFWMAPETRELAYQHYDLNQSEHNISRDLDQWEWSSLSLSFDLIVWPHSPLIKSHQLPPQQTQTKLDRSFTSKDRILTGRI